MFLKIDQYDLLEFFENDPEILCDEGDGQYSYSCKKQDFEMLFVIDIYKQEVMTAIDYNRQIIFFGTFSNVAEIKKDKDILIFISQGDKITIVKKSTLFSVFVETEKNIKK